VAAALNEMKKFVADGTVKSFTLRDPANLGYLATYAAVELASGKITGTQPMAPIVAALGREVPRCDITVRALSLVIQWGPERLWNWQPGERPIWVLRSRPMLPCPASRKDPGYLPSG
jgi:hypothetical protein